VGTLALRLTGATKRYQSRGQARRSAQPVFEEVNLAVETGEIFVLLGPSGCGKSTLLRVLGGLEPLSEGRVEVLADWPGQRNGALGGGEVAPEVTLVPPHPGSVGIAFQEPLLYPWLTVAENVSLSLRYRANHHARAGEPVDQILHDFGLASIADSYPDQLSGGQAQRVSLSRTLVARPTVLLLDEPFSALDPRTRAVLQDWLLEVVRQRHLTVVLVTHDVEEALYLGDRVGLMSSNPGRLLRTWHLGRRDAGASGRRDLDEQERAIRREILSYYQTDVPTAATGASNWVI
jgi:ABC-type nitrate/sulfonate/bicarbonate transport system ATPase subunit